MRVLGVDPGTWNTGVGLIEGQGNRYHLLHFETISVKKKSTVSVRLSQIYRTLLEIIRKYPPDVLALENVFYAKDVCATVRIGEARACAMLAASESGVDIVEYSPARVKQSVSGNGRASKAQVQHMVKTLLNLSDVPPADSADALAVAICHLHRTNIPVLNPWRKKEGLLQLKG